MQCALSRLCLQAEARYFSLASQFWSGIEIQPFKTCSFCQKLLLQNAAKAPERKRWIWEVVEGCNFEGVVCWWTGSHPPLLRASYHVWKLIFVSLDSGVLHSISHVQYRTTAVFFLWWNLRLSLVRRHQIGFERRCTFGAAFEAEKQRSRRDLNWVGSSERLDWENLNPSPTLR